MGYWYFPRGRRNYETDTFIGITIILRVLLLVALIATPQPYIVPGEPVAHNYGLP